MTCDINTEPIAGAIFDLDGTLADTLPIAFSAFREATSEFVDPPFTDEQLSGFFGPSEDGILRRIVPDDWERCLARYLERYEARHAGCAALFPGMEAVLRRLKASGVPLAIVTGKVAQAVGITLRHIDIGHYFDAVEVGSPEGDVKARAITKILDAWGVEGRRVMYVGDTAGDMRAARSRGLIAIGARWAGTMSAHALEQGGARMVFASVAEFDRWLRSAAA
jgi:phosphoglycolate phosphatase-like HAD superfamily hydrolase